MSSQPNSPDRRALLSNALQKIQEMQSRLDKFERAQNEPIAIIGMGCRFPGGANDPESYWALLRDGVNAVREVPADRWDVDAYYDPDPEKPGKTYTRFGGFLDQIDQFDPQFFGITPREASTIDPQQRLVLEVGWEALEDAGHASLSELRGSRTGVFIGVGSSDFAHLQLRGAVEDMDAYTGSGGALCFTAGRFSYCLGLQGPSLSVDTACSSSLAAVHLACQSLRSSECRMAVAGGVNVMVGPESFVLLSRIKALAPDDHCKVFDAGANGFVRGEGCGLVVLKRLSDAIVDGDNILAVIRGSAVNQDGASTGLTVPNGPAQQALISEALTRSGIEPASIDYVEAHGTGTPLGDPIEIGALAATLGPGRTSQHPLTIASVKTNLGHLEAAAGIAGLIKVVLSLRHGEIPRHLHYRSLNPAISFGEVPFVIPTARQPWPAGKRSRIAGVSSFGLSGTNAHAVIEEAPALAPPAVPAERRSHILALSARTPNALRELVHRFTDHLELHPDLRLSEVCFTVNTGRSHFGHRLAIVESTIEGLRTKLLDFNANKRNGVQVSSVESSRRQKVAFLFGGQGEQYARMGQKLYETQPTFRRAIDRVAELFRGEMDRPLLDVLFPAPADAQRIDQAGFAQPAIFALEYALAELWRSWGIEPAIVVGQGVGEFAAACVCGALHLEGAVRLVAARARLLQTLPQDGLAVSDSDLVTMFETTEKAGAGNAPFVTMVRAFEEVGQTVDYAAPRIPWISTLTGEPVSGVIGPNYWIRQIREAAKLNDAFSALRSQEIDLGIEIGPGHVLVESAREHGIDKPGWVGSLRKDGDDWNEILSALGTLYTRGASVDWPTFERDDSRRRVNLPTYPFQRQRFWRGTNRAALPSSSAGDSLRSASADRVHAHLGKESTTPGRQKQNIDDWFYEEHWEEKQLIPTIPASGNQSRGAWILIALGDDSRIPLAKALRARGNHVLVASPGATWNRHSDGTVTLNFDRIEECRRLLCEYPSSEAIRGLVIIGPTNHTKNNFDSDFCRTVVQVAKALGETSGNNPYRVWVVTSGAQSVLRSEHPTLSQAPVLGLVRSLAYEQPAAGWTNVDLDPEILPAGMADLLSDELLAGRDEGEIALRKGNRYVRRLARISTPPADVESRQIRSEATYLITGGLGALGIIMARWLVDQGARHLVLVGRGAARGKSAETIAEFERRGVFVRVMRADVSDEAQMKKLFFDMTQTMPPLAGLIHAAGVIEDGVVANLAWESFERVFAPKVRGAWTLHELAKDLDLDFFVLFSSAASFFGAAGQANYAAANAYLDAMARYRHALHLPALSLNWGPWEGEGMTAALDEVQRRRWQKLGGAMIDVTSGPDALRRALGFGNPGIAIVPIDWAALRGAEVSPAFRKFAATFIQDTASGNSPEGNNFSCPALLALSVEKRTLKLTEYLSRTVAPIIGIPEDEIKPYQGLAELGFDSLMGLELKNRLDLDLKFSLSMAQLLSNRSIQELARLISETMLPQEAGNAAPMAETLAVTMDIEEGVL